MNDKSHNIICISSIDWDFVWQGNQEIMATLARQGHRVLFVENTGVRNVRLQDLPRLRSRLLNWRRGIKGIRKVMDNLYVYAPLLLPFPYSRVARAVNKIIMVWTLKKWARSMQFDNPIIWTWLPTALVLDLIRVLDPQLVVYYCCDNFQASSAGSKRIRETEDQLLRKADLVFVTSKSLFDRCKRFANHLYLFPYGFNREVFTKVFDHVPSDLESIAPPILGYVGGVHKHVDLDLIEQVARYHCDKPLVFVGPLQVDVQKLAHLPNIHFLGQKKYEELPEYIAQFAVCLIPYVLNEYTNNVYPTKLNEYLIMGKPVISTRLPEVEYFKQAYPDLVLVADDATAFCNLVTAVLAMDNQDLRSKRIALAESNAWSQKIEAMKTLIQEKLEEKAKTREVNWQDALRGLSRSLSLKVTVLAIACGLAYWMVAYTPAVRAIAEPLRVANQAVEADVIVVLAGGIGESGERGEAYQEKVKQGVELYQQGWAKRILFSSGQGYVFQEGQVMKALAVSLGVPKEVILLEEQGGGNYLSLLHVKAVLEQNGWHRILVVTSRYNGLRSALIAKRNLPDIAVSVIPPEHSTFFGESGAFTWRQTRAILHEYAAIVYYCWKGYI